MAMDNWRSFLQLAEFIIQTDQKSLVHLDDQRLHTYWQQKAITKLMVLQYKICFKEGSTNKVVDALSRVSHSDIHELSAVSVAQPIWLNELHNSYKQSEESQKLLAELALCGAKDKISLVQGIIKYSDRIWPGHCTTLQQQVIKAFHNNPIGGHSGMRVTYLKIKKLFYWPQMKSHIEQFVANCSVCQQAKTKEYHILDCYNLLLFPRKHDTLSHWISLKAFQSLPIMTVYWW